LGAYEHQDLPFDRIVEAVQPPRDTSYNPLFQVNFRVTSGDAALVDLPGVTAEPVAVDVGFARFDLALELQQKPDGLGGYLEYNVALFTERTARALVDAFGALLTHALRDPDTTVGLLEMSAQSAGSGIRGARRR
jgi:non-ribosomal peptide synthetase component F